MGNERPLADFEDTSYALVFGWNLLGATKGSFCRVSGTGAGQRAPRWSMSILSAIRPQPNQMSGCRSGRGTDGAMALAIGHVLIKKNLVNKPFIDEWCVGFDEYAAYVADKTPEWAEKISSVPAATIERIATEMARPQSREKESWSTLGAAPVTTRTPPLAAMPSRSFLRCSV